MEPLIVAWLEQMDELVGDNHVKALDGVAASSRAMRTAPDLGVHEPQRVFMLRTETRETATPIAISYACTISRSAVATSVA